MTQGGPGPGTIDSFRQRIKTLEGSELILQKALLDKSNQLQDLMGSARRASAALTQAQRLIMDLSKSMKAYRHQWLTECYAFGEVLARVPQPARRRLEDIAVSSRNSFVDPADALDRRS